MEMKEEKHSQDEEKMIQQEMVDSRAFALEPEEDLVLNELHVEEDFSGFTKSELVKQLEDIMAHAELRSSGASVKAIKELYVEISREEYEAGLKKFLENGGVKEDFSPSKDSLDKKMETLLHSFAKRKNEQKKQKEQQLSENLTLKKFIIEEFRNLLKSEGSVSVAFQKFQALQSKWRSTGSVPQQHADELWKTYQFLTDKFFDVIKMNKELKELDYKKNLELKTELCEKAEKLLEESSINKSLQEFSVLQDKWKEIGAVSKEHSDAVWKRFKETADQLYARKKEHLLKIRHQQEENLAAKLVLCEQLETFVESSIDKHGLWQKANDHLDELWNKWRKVGRVPKEDNGNCWSRFKKARQKFFEKREAFYSAVREDYSRNMQHKTELCLKAESLQDSTDWSGTAEVYKKLQRQWKSTGPVSRKDSDKIWARFRSACDKFFDNRTKHFAEKDSQLLANVKVKESIIAKIEQLQPSENTQQYVEELKKLQNEWIVSGEVPYKEAERLNQVYKKVIENQFGHLKEGGAGNEKKMLYRLKYEQLKQTPQGKEQIRREKITLQDRIKKLETEVNKLETNIGFFGKSKNAASMLQEFQQKIDNTKEEIKKLRIQLKMIPSDSE